MATTLKDMGLDSGRLYNLFGNNTGPVCRVVFGKTAWTDPAFTHPDAAMTNDLRALEGIVTELEAAFPPVAEMVQKRNRSRQVWGTLVNTLKARNLYRHPENDPGVTVSKPSVSADQREGKPEQVVGDDMPPPMTDEEFASLAAEADFMAGAGAQDNGTPNSTHPAQEVTKPTRPVAKPFDPAEFEASASHKADVELEKEVAKERGEDPDAIDFSKMPPDEAFAMVRKMPDRELALHEGGLRIKYDISRFSIAKRRGHVVPPLKYLVPGLVPMGAAVVLAADGGLGKGMLELELANIVAQSTIDLLSTWCGVNVSMRGKVVMVMAEDSLDECQRRLQESIGSNLPDNLFILTLPDMGITDPLFVQTKDGAVVPSTTFSIIWDQLVEMRPALVVFDPIAAIADVDLDKDNRAAAAVMKNFAALAQESGAAILLAHHTSKVNSSASPENVRTAIRGATAIVNEARGAIILYRPPRDFCENVCKTIGEDYEYDKVLWMVLCKCNYPGSKVPRILVRDEKGCLKDRTDDYAENMRNTPEAMMDELVEKVAEAAMRGQPFTRFSKDRTGLDLYHRRDELGGVLRNLGLKKLVAMADMLCDKKKLVLCVMGGGRRQWLDVPGGPVAKGEIKSFVKGSTETGNAPAAASIIPGQVVHEGQGEGEALPERADGAQDDNLADRLADMPPEFAENPPSEPPKNRSRQSRQKSAKKSAADFSEKEEEKTADLSSNSNSFEKSATKMKSAGPKTAKKGS